MEIIEILTDALYYPLQNIKALIIYVILGIIFGVVFGAAVGVLAVSFAAQNVLATIGAGVLGFIVILLIGFVVLGYQLDIIKLGIERSDDAPEIDFMRQFINGFKLFVVNFVYLLIPVIISSLLAIFLQHWISIVINFIVGLVFGFALMMGECRLAKTGDMMHALSVGGAISDIGEIGFVKVILLMVLIAVIVFVLFFIAGLISNVNSTIGGIILGIFGVYATFVTGRATGLLYSEI
ncbi:DUF4013 domain-containing protein [Methanobrevibacter sp.]|uniref:DUF4013 domain-containing protein n=1 Tax=Methanobrevibacter sp. TaxID=66852 RepID=UPI0038636103